MKDREKKQARNQPYQQHEPDGSIPESRLCQLRAENRYAEL